MATYKDMNMLDLLQFNFVNLDQLTETYSTSFYVEYLTRWPEYQRMAVHPLTGMPMGYMISKAEGYGEDFHGHVSAVTVAPLFRRLGLGQDLMAEMEHTSEYVHNAFFVDLFVRQSNAVAIAMYEMLGYIVYRRVLNYYQGDAQHGKDDEDALDMRRALARNHVRSASSVIPVDHPVKPEDLQWN
eukprot:gene8828-6211_t